MKFFISKVLFLTCFIIAAFNNHSQAAETVFDVEKANIYTFHAELDQLLIGENGIFVDFGDVLGYQPVKSLSWDPSGFYVITMYKDPNCGHGIYCTNCGGCNPNNRCSWRCKCSPRGR